MKAIKQWTDVKEFQGKVVVFNTKSYYLGDEHGYLIHNNPSERIAMIREYTTLWEGDEEGYGMRLLLKPNEVPSTHAIVNSTLINSDLQMRLARAQELKMVYEAILHGKAYLESHSTEEALSKLRTVLLDNLPYNLSASSSLKSQHIAKC